MNHDERNEALVEIWKEATDEVGQALREHYPSDNPIITIVDSGPRVTSPRPEHWPA